MSSNPSSVLILFAHPAFQKSRVNRRLLQEALELPGVHVQDLYEEYPRFDIQVEREQQLLDRHQIIVFQHPFYWYSTPSLLKEWQDLVLQHGWAYGAGGGALRGKQWLQVVTTGGPETAYCQKGQNRYTVRQLLAPLEQTAYLCGMRFWPPFVVHGTHALTADELERHASDYRQVLLALQQGRINEKKVKDMIRINAELDRSLLPAPGD